MDCVLWDTAVFQPCDSKPNQLRPAYAGEIRLVVMWLLLFTELLGIFHIFVPREGQTESAVASDTDSE